VKKGSLSIQIGWKRRRRRRDMSRREEEHVSLEIK